MRAYAYEDFNKLAADIFYLNFKKKYPKGRGYNAPSEENNQFSNYHAFNFHESRRNLKDIIIENWLETCRNGMRAKDRLIYNFAKEGFYISKANFASCLISVFEYVNNFFTVVSMLEDEGLDVETVCGIKQNMANIPELLSESNYQVISGYSNIECAPFDDTLLKKMKENINPSSPINFSIDNAINDYQRMSSKFDIIFSTFKYVDQAKRGDNKYKGYFPEPALYKYTEEEYAVRKMIKNSRRRAAAV